MLYQMSKKKGGFSMELSKEDKEIYKKIGTNLGKIRGNNPNGKFYSQNEIAKIIKMNCLLLFGLQ